MINPIMQSFIFVPQWLNRVTCVRTLISFHPVVLVTVKVLSLPECVMDFEERKVNKQMLLFAEPNLGEALRSHLNFPDNVVGVSNPQE